MFTIDVNSCELTNASANDGLTLNYYYYFHKINNLFHRLGVPYGLVRTSEVKKINLIFFFKRSICRLVLHVVDRLSTQPHICLQTPFVAFKVLD